MLRHEVNTDSDLGGAVGELFSGWMNAIGIGSSSTPTTRTSSSSVIVDGDYDTFYWGWVPFVDPDPMLSYFTEAELGNYNDANWTDAEVRGALPRSRSRRSIRIGRLDIVHEMVRLIYDNAVYIAMWYSPDLQAYRTDKFEGWRPQPADIGPVIFSQSSPSYAPLRPIGVEPKPPVRAATATRRPRRRRRRVDRRIADAGDESTARTDRRGRPHRHRWT